VVDDWSTDSSDQEEDASCEQQERAEVVEETHYDILLRFLSISVLPYWLIIAFSEILKVIVSVVAFVVV